MLLPGVRAAGGIGRRSRDSTGVIGRKRTSNPRQERRHDCREEPARPKQTRKIVGDAPARRPGRPASTSPWWPSRCTGTSSARVSAPSTSSSTRSWTPPARTPTPSRSAPRRSASAPDGRAATVAKTSGIDTVTDGWVKDTDVVDIMVAALGSVITPDARAHRRDGRARPGDPGHPDQAHAPIWRSTTGCSRRRTSRRSDRRDRQHRAGFRRTLCWSCRGRPRSQAMAARPVGRRTSADGPLGERICDRRPVRHWSRSTGSVPRRASARTSGFRRRRP